jgi:predicted lipoprotein with Yx(FWY)xxD motif
LVNPRRAGVRITGMKLTLTALALATALALGACGSDNDDNDSAEAAGAAATVAVESIDGADVLVDSEGAALYTSEQEEDGKVRCTDECASIWLPLTLSGPGEPTAESDVSGELGVVERPDGARQVTLDGSPLYRFADDGGPGKVTGDDLSDSFGGRRFTWHVESTGAAPSDSGDTGGSYSY